MAGFRVHVTTAAVAGVCVSGFGLLSAGLGLVQGFAVFVMGVVGGVLPDLDSDSGRPLEILFGTLSVLLPAVFLGNFAEGKSLAPEFLISYFVLSFLFVNYFICGLIKKMTVHRGIMHSFPFAILSSAVVYLFLVSSGEKFSVFATSSLLLGYLSHLVLDELNSFAFDKGFIPRVKSSFGTAFKFKSNNRLIDFLVYMMVAVSLSLIFLI